MSESGRTVLAQRSRRRRSLCRWSNISIEFLKKQLFFSPILGTMAHWTISWALWWTGNRMMRMSSWNVYIIALSITILMTPIKSRGEWFKTPSSVDERCWRQILNAIIPVVIVFCAKAKGYIVAIHCKTTFSDWDPGCVNQNSKAALLAVSKN